MNTRVCISIFFLFTVLTMSSCADEKEGRNNSETDKKIEIIAHRGDSYFAPENTMAAVHSAWEKNTDAVEVDVYLSKDNRVVVIHDATTARTGDKDLVIKQTSSEALRKVDVGSFKGAEFEGEQIPFLEEVIASVPPGKRLFIEIKGTGEAVPFIKELVVESGKQDQMVIIGFNLQTVTAAKEIMPQIPVFWLHSAPKDKENNPLPVPLDIIATAKEHNLDGVNINYKGITKEFVEECRKKDQQVYVWTVDNKSDIKHVARLGVDGITTNRIDNAQEVLGR